MSSFRQTRGVDTNFGAKTPLDAKRSQWNLFTAQRVLNSYFPEETLPDGSTVGENRIAKEVKYNPITLAEKAREYFLDIYENNLQGVPIIPDIEDFCMYARISRLEFLQICQGSDLEMARIGNNVRTAISMCKKQLAFDGQIPPVVFAIDFNNNHDYIQAKNTLEIKAEYAVDAQEQINDIASRLPQHELKPPQIEG